MSPSGTDTMGASGVVGEPSAVLGEVLAVTGEERDEVVPGVGRCSREVELDIGFVVGRGEEVQEWEVEGPGQSATSSTAVKTRMRDPVTEPFGLRDRGLGPTSPR